MYDREGPSGNEPPAWRPAGTASEPQPPFVLLEPGYLMAFERLDDLLGYVEPMDVQRGRYEVMDSTGRIVRLSARSGGIAADCTATADPDRLRAAVLDFICRVGPGRLGLGEPIESYDTAELLRPLLSRI
jgi:hypothetical protein